MIKFFRRIRQKLLSENKFSKYLLYAIGEIILVVIGILIALQINNWNENRKDRTLEHSTLIEIKNSLELDSKLLKDEIEFQLDNALVSTQLLNHIRQKKPYDSKLDVMWERIIRYYFVDFNTSAYTLLESRGIDIIQNETLRRKIVDHYNIHQRNLERSVDVGEHLSNENLIYFFDRVYPDITPNFKKTYKIDNEYWTPADYQTLLNDSKLIPKISHSIKVRYRFSKLLDEFVKKQEKLIREIEKELNNK
ncbi:MAG: hypothetical protein ED555_02985 [Allomuricauda sp.]|nr:MAG: hypothetical protein ED555_02985 [Allomuricauda sp.]